MKSYEIIISGLVQGVNFRHYTKKKADFLGIKGTVKNQDDGTVKIICTGNKYDVEKLIGWCRKGPEYSSVKSVDIKEIELKKYSDFNILY